MLQDSVFFWPKTVFANLHKCVKNVKMLIIFFLLFQHSCPHLPRIELILGWFIVVSIIFSIVFGPNLYWHFLVHLRSFCSMLQILFAQKVVLILLFLCYWFRFCAFTLFLYSCCIWCCFCCCFCSCFVWFFVLLCYCIVMHSILLYNWWISQSISLLFYFE